LTVSLTILPSADLPSSLDSAAFITIPISFNEFAPVSEMAVLTAASISSFDAAFGRYFSIIPLNKWRHHFLIHGESNTLSVRSLAAKTLSA